MAADRHPASARWQARVALATTALMLLGLAGCGGGDAVDASAQAASSTDTPMRRLADERPTETVIFTFAALMDWAEVNYPQFFPAGPSTVISGGRVSRTYANGNSLILENDNILLQGPGIGSSLPVVYAPLTDFCNSQPVACANKALRKLTIGGVEREYIVYQPWKSRPLSSRKLVFMVHGTGQSASDMVLNTGWRELADRDGVVVVFPQALRHCFKEDDNRNGVFENAIQAAALNPPGRSEVHTPTKWAAADLGDPTLFPLCTPAEYAAEVPAAQKSSVSATLADDLAYFDAMTAELLANDRINPKWIWVSGFSHGGAMTARLAAERSLVYAAAASTAGVATPGFPPAPRAMPFVFAVGELDDGYTVPLNAGQPLPLTEVKLQPGQSGAGIADRLLRPFTVPLQLDPSVYTFTSVGYPGATIALYSFSSSMAKPAQNNVFHFAIVQGMTHVYPNGPAGGGHPLFMAEVLWSFFQNNPMP
jgi:poly(3-hydroxybutyrate) depolymerase